MIFKVQLLYGLLSPVIIILVAAACNQSLRDHQQLPDKISFNSHIRPILSDKCFACHGPNANNDKQACGWTLLKTPMRHWLRSGGTCVGTR